MFTCIKEPTGKIYLLEERPAEHGRCCIVEFSEGRQKDVLPNEYSARTTVHEYGGAAFTISPDDNIIFADWKTKGVFILSPESSQVAPILEADPKIYYADFNVHPSETKWVLAVQENHHGKEVVNSIVAIDASTSKIRTIASGADFYSHPRFSPNGHQVCWIQ